MSLTKIQDCTPDQILGILRSILDEIEDSDRDGYGLRAGMFIRYGHEISILYNAPVVSISKLSSKFNGDVAKFVGGLDSKEICGVLKALFFDSVNHMERNSSHVSINFGIVLARKIVQALNIEPIQIDDYDLNSKGSQNNRGGVYLSKVVESKPLPTPSENETESEIDVDQDGFALVSTSSLSGEALDWAILTIKGEKIISIDGSLWVDTSVESMIKGKSGLWLSHVSFTKNGSLSCDIIENEKIATRFDDSWSATKNDGNYDSKVTLAFGETMLIAAMRCYVISKIGYEMKLPTSLCAPGIETIKPPQSKLTPRPK